MPFPLSVFPLAEVADQTELYHKQIAVKKGVRSLSLGHLPHRGHIAQLRPNVSLSNLTDGT